MVSEIFFFNWLVYLIMWSRTSVIAIWNWSFFVVCLLSNINIGTRYTDAMSFVLFVLIWNYASWSLHEYLYIMFTSLLLATWQLPPRLNVETYLRSCTNTYIIYICHRCINTTLLIDSFTMSWPCYDMASKTVEPLLRGHPDERPPPLERPLDNVNLYINVLISTPDERPPFLKGHFSGLHYILKNQCSIPVQSFICEKYNVNYLCFVAFRTSVPRGPMQQLKVPLM